MNLTAAHPFYDEVIHQYMHEDRRKISCFIIRPETPGVFAVNLVSLHVVCCV